MPNPTDIDHSAPVVANHRISIKGPRELVWKLHTDISAWPTWQTDIKEAVLEGQLELGHSFRWTTFGMTITSTVYALEAGSRVLWGGNAGDIVGIHEWTFTETPSGVDVTTSESFGGATVAKDAANMQALLDQSLVDWLQRLKTTAESKR